MNKKYIIKTKKIDSWVRTDIRFLKEGISISDEYRSILIKYYEITHLTLDENLILTLLYTKNNSMEKTFGTEKIDCNKNIMKLISKKSKIKIKKVKTINNKLQKDKVVLMGTCKYQNNQEENVYYITHKKIILIIDNKQFIFYISNIKDMSKIETNGLQFIYGNNKYIIYFKNLNQIILFINQNKSYVNNYDDNVDLSDPILKCEERKIKKFNIFTYIIILIIILIIIYFIYNYTNILK